MKEMKLEERNLKKKILILVVSMALLVGILSGCTEEETPPAANVAPVSAITCIATGTVDESIAFVSAATDEDGTIASWSWSIDAGAEAGTEATFTTSFAASGTYTITLTVTDDDGDSHSTDCVITITNPPTVTIEALPTTITNTTILTFTAVPTVGDGEINATTGYAWYIDDVVQVGETNVTYTASEFADGIYIVKVIVTDDTPLTGQATVTVTVPTAPVE